jgi:hypothetical protein
MRRRMRRRRRRRGRGRMRRVGGEVYEVAEEGGGAVGGEEGDADGEKASGGEAGGRGKSVEGGASESSPDADQGVGIMPDGAGVEVVGDLVGLQEAGRENGHAGGEEGAEEGDENVGERATASCGGGIRHAGRIKEKREKEKNEQKKFTLLCF